MRFFVVVHLRFREWIFLCKEIFMNTIERKYVVETAVCGSIPCA